MTTVYENKCMYYEKSHRAKKSILPRIISDHLGSIRVVLNEQGNVDSWSDYYPFGKESRGSSTNNEPKEQFTGKERDIEIGLDYFGARYYNYDVARFMTIDPLVQKYPQWSPYVYAGNMPVRFVDVDGKGPGTPMPGPIVMHEIYSKAAPQLTAAVDKMVGGLASAVVGAAAAASTPVTLGAGLLGVGTMLGGITQTGVGAADFIQACKGKSETDVYHKTANAFGITNEQADVISLAISLTSGKDALSNLKNGIKTGDLIKMLQGASAMKDINDDTKKVINNLLEELNKKEQSEKEKEKKEKEEEEKKNKEKQEEEK